MKKKIFLSVLLLAVMAGSGTWYYVFEYSKTHHRQVKDESGIPVTAKALVKEFQTSEPTANAKYLNKAVEVSAEVAETKTDQAGNITVTLKSDDAFANVLCTLIAGNKPPKTGASVIIKGICNGFLSDVVLNEAIIKNEY